jgi:hypothetical protein
MFKDSSNDFFPQLRSVKQWVWGTMCCMLANHIMESDNKSVLFAGAVANLRGCGKESASILFWVHIFAVFSMAGWIIFYLTLLF